MTETRGTGTKQWRLFRSPPPRAISAPQCPRAWRHATTGFAGCSGQLPRGLSRVSCTRPKRIPYHRTSAPSRDRSQPSQKAVLKCAHDEVIFSLRTKPCFHFFEPSRFAVFRRRAESLRVTPGSASHQSLHHSLASSAVRNLISIVPHQSSSVKPGKARNSRQSPASKSEPGNGSPSPLAV